MKIRQHTWTKRVAIISLMAVTLPMVTNVAQASSTAALAPHKGAYGYFQDTYKQNVEGNTTVQNNPVVGEMSEFSKYWSNGQTLNAPLLKENIDKAAKVTQTRSYAETERSYLTDWRDLRYNLIDGLGPYSSAFIKNADAKTDYMSMPTTPDPVNTPWSKTQWASPTSKLGPMVKLMNTTSYQPFTATGVVKHVVKYLRPYRQSSEVKVVPALAKVMAAAPADDYDFPSGHTTAGFETGMTLAYLVPERYQQLLTRSSEIGYDRVLAGRHTPLATMGGRMVGTAMAAAALNDPANQALMKEAYSNAHSSALLQSSDATAQDQFGDYQKNRADWRYRMTYGFNQIGDTHQAVRVPKGAEVLLATRLPYLTDTQRRDVLFTTGMPSGYPVMDDAEGWGRLDLFSAANGYGQFNDTVKVNMDAKKGQFAAKDNWRNDIGGKGSLVKSGTGLLQLSGKNTFSGGTTVKGGTLQLTSNTAAGQGKVTVQGGTLQLTNQKVTVKGTYQQTKRGQLKLAKDTKVTINKSAKLAGTLRLTGGKWKNGTTLLTYKHHAGKFTHVKGLPKGLHVVYTKHAVKLAK